MQTTTICDIEIITQHNALTLVNLISGAMFRFNQKENLTMYKDSFGNTMQNKFGTITINNVVCKLTTVGDNIKFENGTSIVLLTTKDILEIAERTFYEKGQPQIYDFIELKFK
jgi:hypothetical protein